MNSKLLTLTVAGGLLLVPATASATDAEIQQTIKDGSTKIIAAEKKVSKAGTAFDKKPTAATLKKFRAAAREEEALLDDLAETLKGQQPDTPTVGEGRDLIVQGIEKCASGLDRIDKALGKAKKGKEKAAVASIKKAEKQIAAGNKLIEQGEPKAGAELTPSTDSTKS
jgi:uncharacterized phage infection (PIP) family protein YhgE